MPDSPNQPSEQERLEALAGYRDRADEIGFERFCYKFGWVEPFDWGKWKDTEEAIQLRDDPDVLAQATPLHLQKLLTVIIRQDRFVTGLIQYHFESGLIDGIMDRAKALVEDKD